MKTPTNNIPSIGPLYADDLQNRNINLFWAANFIFP